MLGLMLLACSNQPDKDTATIETQPTFAELAIDGSTTVQSVEPTRYLGLWYEIASTPMAQQASCTGTTAEYTLKDDTSINVYNRCYLGSLDGEENTILGSARFIDDSYAKLLVDFGFGFEAPYNIVELDGQSGEDPYEFAAVASIGSLWILSRTPEIDDELLSELLTRLESRDFPVEDLQYTEHKSE